MMVNINDRKFNSDVASRFSYTLKERPDIWAQSLPTGIPEVDAISGGLPRGAITEFAGLESSGRTSMFLSILAQATAIQEVCALVDCYDQLDAASASQTGIDLDRMLWVRCAGRFENAFKSIDLLLQSGGFGLVILDILDLPPIDARRIIPSWWFRFRRAIESTPTTLVVMAQAPIAGSCSSLIFKTRREAAIWSPGTPYSLQEDQAGSLHAGIAKCNSEQKELSLNEANDISANYCSSLLRGVRLRVERCKPVHPSHRDICFDITTSH